MPERKVKMSTLTDYETSYSSYFFFLFCTFSQLCFLIIVKRFSAVPDYAHLSGCTFCSIHRRTFFGFTKVLVVRMAAPQLLAGVVRSKLSEETEISSLSNLYGKKLAHSVSYFTTTEEYSS